MTLRVRFAPSPTGFLHVGGARTALFNWLLARRHGGTFLLRIEDTDRERSSEDMVRGILEGMRWLGLDWDEEIVFQGQGVERHRADALTLLERGFAYRDFTDPAELASLRETDPDRVIRFPREAAEAMAPGEAEERSDAGEPHAIRFRVPVGETAWEDQVHGLTRFRNVDIEDLVLLRSDGTPTYNLAVASDDAAMHITHVLRGDDHISNTPKQILIHEALGNPIPTFAHLPMILGGDGKRLSKRHGASAVGDYAGLDILPDAMVNFLALLGWSPGTDEEVLSREELIERFSLDRVVKRSAVFDPQKLEWLNGRHLSQIPAPQLLQTVLDRIGSDTPKARTEAEEWLAARSAASGHPSRTGRHPGEAPSEHPGEHPGERPGDYPGEALMELLKPRARTTGDLAAQARIYLLDAVDYDPEALRNHWFKDPAGARERLTELRDAFGGMGEDRWTEEDLEVALRALAVRREEGAGKLIHPLRVALTGQAVSPGIFEVLVVLGRERVFLRMDRALQRLAEPQGARA